jgi:hypothetical protein
MNRTKRILVILESLDLRKETIQYTMALAERIEGEITLLLLLPNHPDSESQIADRGRGLLRKEVEAISGKGIEAKYELRIGDPRSEFFKFMASHPSFHTAIWGGNENVLTGASGRSADHWVATIQNDLNCPLVISKKK